MRKIVSLSLALAASAGVATADIQLPQVSPAASVKQSIGVTDFEITYHRPGVNGRTIWGGLVPYDQIWRLGANEATTFAASSPFRIDGHEVAAGTYALFAIPGKEWWTFILDKNPKQWGAFSHKDADDVLRFQAKPHEGPFVERMEFAISPESDAAAKVELAWEKLRVAFQVQVDTPKIVWQGIDAALAKSPDAGAYRAAVRYALQDNSHQAEAMGWIDKAIAAGESWSNYDLKAQLLERAGKTKEAIALEEKALQTAEQAKASSEQTDQIKKRLADWKAKH